jgi:hypothetical protein
MPNNSEKVMPINSESDRLRAKDGVRERKHAVSLSVETGEKFKSGRKEPTLIVEAVPHDYRKHFGTVLALCEAPSRPRALV